MALPGLPRGTVRAILQQVSRPEVAVCDLDLEGLDLQAAVQQMRGLLAQSGHVAGPLFWTWGRATTAPVPKAMGGSPPITLCEVSEGQVARHFSGDSALGSLSW